MLFYIDVATLGLNPGKMFTPSSSLITKVNCL